MAGTIKTEGVASVYCKNCGKKLPDNARFCDRCNMSVRKKESRMELIEELKEERLARRKAQAVEERLKKIKKIKNKRRKMIASVICAVIALGIISGAGVYIYYAATSEFNQPLEDVPEITDVPKTDKPTAAASAGNATKKPEINSDGYIVTRLGELSFAYPQSFAPDNGNKDMQLSMKDNSGDATLTGNREFTDKDAKSIMKTYADSKGGKVEESLAGDKRYTVTVVNGGKVYHRTGMVREGTETYYEIVYPSSSARKSVYESNITYMDSYFKDE